jgi:tetratricopeptide (TPR) repeat protein
VPGDVIPRARAAALQALKLDDNLAEAHASLGIIKAQYDWDRPGAAQQLRRAIELNPNYASAHQWLGEYFYANGQFDEALTEFRACAAARPALADRRRHRDMAAAAPGGNTMRPYSSCRKSWTCTRMGATSAAISMIFAANGSSNRKKYDDAVADFVQGFRTKDLTGGSPVAVEALTTRVPGVRDHGLLAETAGFWR